MNLTFVAVVVSLYVLALPLNVDSFECILNRTPTSDNTSISIGFLTSIKFGVGKRTAGAIQLAVERVNNDTSLLPNHTLKLVPGDYVQPDSAMPIRYMTQLMKEGIVAFIGPDGSCAEEALVAAAWNLPMIAYVS
ncbi:guanylate cyclase 32E-like protein [Leptotrombidium deliense]|uniref:Guanylate cyclase 32E-like protein n=1 Tax=Leptotrombidium deliense TaxID=299467 RepID=A0A443S6N2_9ACAR|nr:guanylate cyclase 32E-like protein [Leptotrombidium deliense]